MKWPKRIFLFVVVNFLIFATLSLILSLVGVRPYLSAKGIDYSQLMIFCLLWGFGGAFVSLALSRIMAKWLMGVKLIEANTADPQLAALVSRVHHFARNSGLRVMPQVGIYESEELNAFATGPTKNRALVAVSTGLLYQMNRDEIDGVLAHEVAHIANGDMVTMTLVQGVVNSLVMFVARVAAFFITQFVSEERRAFAQMAVVFGLEIVLGFLGMMVVGYFSRRREYRADHGGATLASTGNMIAALERLKANAFLPATDEHASLATLKISGKGNRWLKLFSTHPDIDDRIARLKSQANFTSMRAVSY